MYQNKIVLITGASRGIGKSLAIAYAEAGATVYGLDIIEADYSHQNITSIIQDLSNWVGIDDLFAKIGTVHILINNGAIARFNKSIFDITNEEFQTVINVNLNGAFACSRAFIKANSGQSYGRIINISSTRFNQNEAGWEAYGASKGALISLTNSMAISLSETPITVNAISPGWIETQNYEQLSEEDHTQHPSGRVGKPSDIVRASMFLTDPNNDFVNGHNLIIDGGMTKKMIYVD